MNEDLLDAVLPEERRLQVAAMLRRDTRVRVEELAEAFAVSGETIRRDLKALEDRGLARRVYGGAVAVASEPAHADVNRGSISRFPRPDSPSSLEDAERSIAAYAAQLVQPGETTMLDLGPVVAATARALPLTLTGRVLCASVATAALLAGRRGLETHLAGGRLRPEDLACVDDAAERFFDRFFAHRAFVTADGVDPRAGVTSEKLEEIAVRRAMLRQAAESYVLVPAVKLGTVAVGRVAALSEVTGVVTDSSVSQALVAALELAGVRVAVAPPVPRLE